MIKKFSRGFFALLVMQLLVACGGGEDCQFKGSCGGIAGGGETLKPAITVSLESSTTHDTITQVTPTDTGILVATVTGTNQPVIVTFTLPSGTKEVVTKNGRATVPIVNSGLNSVVTVSVSMTVDGATYTDDMFFEFVAQSITLKLLSSVTGLETTFSSAVDRGRLVASVVGAPGPVLVTFSTTLGGVSNSGGAMTNGLNEATVDLVPGASIGAARATASVVIDSKTYSQDLAYEIVPASATPAGKQLQFVSATPEAIGLKGTGADETSVVVFSVVDDSGNPVTNQSIDFQLNTTAGGITMTPSTASSDSNGLVKTIVSSGSISTSVRVTAILKDNLGAVISSVQSSKLVISTGIPDQDSFSISATDVSTESWGYDGITTSINARLADGFNNPVADGTIVFFSTEGGQIEPSCQTVGGACSVIWTSQAPRPAGATLSSTEPSAVEHTPGSLGQPYGGRVMVTATAIGEESFPDLNGNGRFDASEMTAFSGKNTQGEYYDLVEAFADFNEDGVYGITSDPLLEAGGTLEELIDFNVNGIWDDKDGKYNGSLCSIPAHAGCSSTHTVNVRGQVVLVMAGSTPYVSLTDMGSYAELCISDLHNQPMPTGTTVALEWDGSLGTMNPLTFEITKEAQSFILGSSNSNGPQCISRILNDASITGVVKVSIATPKQITLPMYRYIPYVP